MLKRTIHLNGIFLLSLAILSAEPRVQVIVSDDKLIEGQSFTLEIRSEDGEIQNVSLDGLTNFRIISGPVTSSRVQIINGIVSSSTRFTWTLKPAKTGRLEIPSFQVQVGSVIVMTEPVTVEVAAATELGSPDNKELEPIFLGVEIDPKKVFRGEQITVAWTLYTQLNISGWEITTLPNLTGFWTEELFAPNRLQLREKVIQGRRYYTAVVRRMALFPTQSGELEIDPLILKIGVQLRNRRQFDPFLDDFSLINPGRVEHRVLASPSMQVSVQSTPFEDRPPDYTGLVGRFRISGTLDEDEVTQDEAVTLKLIVEGEGNLKAVENPTIEFPSGLEVFEPKLDIEPALGDIVGGAKTVEYIIIPREAGRFAIPQIRLPFFNPTTARYEVGIAGPFTLNVLARNDFYADSPGFSRREVALLGKDIRFLKVGKPRWLRTGKGWYTPTLLFLNLATVIFFLLPIAGPHLLRISAMFTPGIRERRAYSLAIQMIDKGNGKPEQIYLSLTQAITLFLNYKLRRDTTEYTIQQVHELLAEHHIAEDIRAQVVEVLEHAAAARFAQTRGGGAVADKDLIKGLLAKVESGWGK